MSKSFERGRWLQSGLTLAMLLFAALPAAAFQFTLGEVQASLDTTVSYGLNWRASERDQDLIGTMNGGSAYSVNGDDGNLNYDDEEYFSKVFKITSDLEMKYQNYGLFLRGTAFYDFVNANGDGGERTEITDSEALDMVGQDADLLDAYLWWDFDIGGLPGTLRVGNQVLSWGESTFIQNSINTINPVDLNKLRAPGSELKEALVPVGMVSASLAANQYLSIEGFYQYNWEKTEVDPPGSYWSTNDFIGAGGNLVFLGWGDVSDLGTTNPLFPLFGMDPYQPEFLAVSRLGDETPSDDGQYGIALHLLAPQLNDTEFGFYFINYHSRLPIVSAKTGTDAGVAAAQNLFGINSYVAVDKYAQTAGYFEEYVEDIKLYGVSFSTQLNATGTAIQGEYSYRQDLPLQVDDVELLLAALSPLDTGALSSALPYSDNQLGGVQETSTIIHGYEQLDVSQVQVTATQNFGPTFGADQFIVIGEVGLTYVHDMPKKSELRLDSAGTYVSGNPAQAEPGGAHAGKPAEPSDAFADATSWGYRAVARFDFNNAIGAVTLSPRLAWAHDVSGNSPNPGGNFLEDRKAITYGLGADYQNAWSADLSYTDFFGAGRYNLINDRDYVSFNVKYSF